MSIRNRRVFMLHAVCGAAALGAHNAAQAQAAPAAKAPPAAKGPAPVDGPVSTEAVKETDAYPKSMGFKLNTANVDKAKFPRHDVSQKCSECQLYSGKPGEAQGPCSFFKRMVNPEGWCRNFKPKKAA